MSVPATLIQSAIVSLISANASIAAEFSGKISAGMGRNFNFNDDVRGIRVYLHGEAHDIADVTTNRRKSQYDFLMIAMFYEQDGATAETKKADYGRWLIDSIVADLSLGGNTEMIDFGKTQYREDPTTDGVHYVVVPVSAVAIR